MPTRAAVVLALSSCMRPPAGHNSRAIPSSLFALLPRSIWRNYSTLFGIKKDATSAPTKCLHNGIILIVYILQIYANNLFVFFGDMLYNNAAKNLRHRRCCVPKIGELRAITHQFLIQISEHYPITISLPLRYLCARVALPYH